MNIGDSKARFIFKKNSTIESNCSVMSEDGMSDTIEEDRIIITQEYTPLIY